MKLFLDLKKAAPSVSLDAPSERHAKREYDESFVKRPPGVSGGSARPDKDDVGAKWKNSPDASLDEELEDDRKLDSEVSKERGLTPKDEVKKSLEGVFDFCKSMTGSHHDFMESEIEFLTQERGYSLSEIRKGNVTMSARERAMFADWIHERLQKSVSRLV